MTAGHAPDGKDEKPGATPPPGMRPPGMHPPGMRPAAMRYVSTRGAAPALSFSEALLAGMASDGGLYMPERWPELDFGAIRRLQGVGWVDTALAIMRPFIGEEDIPEAELRSILESAVARFDHRAVTPLVQTGARQWLLELFHGPTLSFKDVALQILGGLFDHVLAREGRRVTVLGATSGDTGSAAIAACRGRAAIDAVILYPRGRISEVQRRQMTTVADANIHAVAVEGSFDDCQALVKAAFADPDLRARFGLAAVNSINWARILAQMVYYAAAAAALGAPDRAIQAVVPTGNFGNVFAGWAARRIGVPISELVVATNANDILARFFASGEMVAAPVRESLSPAMDIQAPSNFERLLFEIGHRDGDRVAQAMEDFRRHGRFSVSPAELAHLKEIFRAEAVSDSETRHSLAEMAGATGWLVDPHTAVGLAAAARAAPAEPSRPQVALACAHPAKFPEAVSAATGRHPALPPALADLFDRPERGHVIPGELDALAGLLTESCGARRGLETPS